MAKTKLELTWIGKENRPKLGTRLPLEEPDNAARVSQPLDRIKVPHRYKGFPPSQKLTGRIGWIQWLGK